ncbi:MAG TPA: hypothetical protein VL979_02085 [Solirubrobacteraceae bacterium]|nr:hypothetical protein [Solirubrobacteraceae bacterium]
MPWASFDDGTHDDPRILDAGLAGAGLYLCVTCYMARHLTDGVISRKAIDKILEDGDTAPLDALLRTGLLVELGDDYEAPEFLKANRSREKVEQDRAEATERQRKWREKQKRKREERERDA